MSIYNDEPYMQTVEIYIPFRKLLRDAVPSADRV